MASNINRFDAAPVRGITARAVGPFVRLLAVAAGALLLAACGAQTVEGGAAAADDEVQPQVELHGAQWTVERLADEEAIADAPATLNFEQDGRVWGSTGCNRINGGYEHVGGSIRFTALAVTRMACPDPLMRQEAVFLQIIESAQTVHMTSNGWLVIRSDEGDILARGH